MTNPAISWLSRQNHDVLRLTCQMTEKEWSWNGIESFLLLMMECSSLLIAKCDADLYPWAWCLVGWWILCRHLLNFNQPEANKFLCIDSLFVPSIAMPQICVKIRKLLQGSLSGKSLQISKHRIEGRGRYYVLEKAVNQPFTDHICLKEVLNEDWIDRASYLMNFYYVMVWTWLW